MLRTVKFLQKVSSLSPSSPPQVSKNPGSEIGHLYFSCRKNAAKRGKEPAFTRRAQANHDKGTSQPKRKYTVHRSR